MTRVKGEMSLDTFLKVQISGREEIKELSSLCIIMKKFVLEHLVK